MFVSWCLKSWCPNASRTRVAFTVLAVAMPCRAALATDPALASSSPNIYGVNMAGAAVPSLPGSFQMGADHCATRHTNAGTGDVVGVPFVNGTTGTTGQNEALCYAFGTWGITNDVWFDWTANATGSATLTFCGSTPVDTKVAVWPNNSPASCPPDGTSLACNDNACGPQSSVTWSVTAGSTYTFQVGTFPGAAGGSGTFDVIQSIGIPCSTPTSYLGPPPDAQVVSGLTPACWQRGDVRWSGDTAPHNKVDDSIDAAPDQEFDIVVNYKRCVTQADVDFLDNVSPTSQVQLVCRYISSVAVSGVRKADIAVISHIHDVAFIEEQIVFTASLDVSVEAMKVATGFYSPNTIEDTFPTLDGSGVNIAIMDTGVDNATHLAFQGTPFIAGYDATAATPSITDPDDDHGHGTHVASIALGQAFWDGTLNHGRGVAPAAGLIDVKVLDSTGSAPWPRVIDGLQTIYDNQATWNVRVVNISLGGWSFTDDGTDALSQLVDGAEARGILVVAAAGNCGCPHPTLCPSYITGCPCGNPGISRPAAASRALAVGAAGDMGSPDRTDDLMVGFSNCGPRMSNNDSNLLDELKPEVVSYGVLIDGARHDTPDQGVVKSGTSMAAPHVAGLAALICQMKPLASPSSIRSLIIWSAEERDTPTFPTIDLTWNRIWGWGLVDAWAALGSSIDTDLTFPSDPPNPFWNSPDITTDPFPAAPNKDTTITVQVENEGPSTAFGAHVTFGIHLLSAAVPSFYEIGTVILDLPVGPSSVEILWTPAAEEHQCVQVDLSYGCDTDPTNNRAQRNLTVAQSPVYFQISNTLIDAPVPIELEVSCQDGDTSGWEVQLTPSSVTLAPDDCPVRVEALAIPPITAAHGDTITVNVAAKIGTEVLGGVSIIATKKDCNGNGVDDYFDIQSAESEDENRDGIPDECQSFDGVGINIDVGMSTGGPSDSYGAASQAGYWNVLTGGLPYAEVLSDLQGNRTTITVEASAIGDGFEDFSSEVPGTSGDDEALLDDFQHVGDGAASSQATWSFAGLKDGAYEVYVYAVSAMGTGGQTSVSDCSGPAQIVSGNWPGLHEEGTTYARIPVQVTDGTFQICVDALGLPGNNAVVSGFQIVPRCIGLAYCFGDGSGTPCPCGNAGGSGEGCANSTGSGAVVCATGSASVEADDLMFEATNLRPNQPALLFAGQNAVNGGDGVQFGDGLRCAGGSVVRLGVRVPDVNGQASWGPGLGSTGGWQSGDVRRFQVWYRNPAGSPCGFAFNLTNGIEIAFVP